MQEEEPEPKQSVASSAAGGKQAIAEYDYEKDEDNEIGFTEGEKIVDIEFVDEDWWQGTNSKGETGLFPASYVSLVESTSSAAAAPEAPSLPSRDQPVEEKNHPDCLQLLNMITRPQRITSLLSRKVISSLISTKLMMIGG